MFPFPTLSVNPRSGIERRHHLFEEKLSRKLKIAVEQAAIAKHVSVHTLRHTFATQMLQSGTDIRTVKELLDHGDVSTTMIYTHVLKVAAGGAKGAYPEFCVRGHNMHPEGAINDRFTQSCQGQATQT